MKYALILVTHGDAPELDRTLASFAEMVTPAPSSLVCVADGPGQAPLADQLGPWLVVRSQKQEGYCRTFGRAWDEAAHGGQEWVYWLEHDWLHTRPIDLTDLAAVLDAEPHVAQMTLVRQPWIHEVPHGGFIAQNPGAYVERETLGHPWLEHVQCWSGNPSLFRAAVPRAHPWPTQSRCEGIVGIEMRARQPGLTFGLWGWWENRKQEREPDIMHIGETGTGIGY